LSLAGVAVASSAAAVARVPDKFTPIYLTQDDVPGAKLIHDNIEDQTIEQLRRWLVCRGMTHSRLNKEQLVSR